MVDRCLCCGEVIPEGQQVCKNCLVAAKEMGIRLKHKKHWTTVLKDIWYNFLCGWLVGMAVIGHWFIGLLIVFLATDGNATNLWCLVALGMGSVLITLGILRYVVRGGKW